MRPETQIVLRFAKLTENAFAPVKGSVKAAGFDLRSAYDCKIPAKGKEIVKTDLQIHVPEGSYGRVAPRSGLAAKNFIDVGAGVIDEDYRGNVGVVLFNHSETEFEIKRGDRIAQLICERIFYPELVEEKSLEETKRGSDGFGSTGIKGDGKDKEMECKMEKEDNNGCKKDVEMDNESNKDKEDEKDSGCKKNKGDDNGCKDIEENEPKRLKEDKSAD